MQAANGVIFETTQQGWKAILPAGPCLPEAVVVEQGPDGLSAHLQEPLDRVTLSCQHQIDGSVQLFTAPDQNWQRALFRPDSLEYGLESSYAGYVRKETYLPDGSWRFRAQAGNEVHQATRLPDGRLESFSHRQGKQSSGVRVEGGQVVFGPKQTLAEEIGQKGLLAGLWSCAQAQFASPVAFALNQGTELFRTLSPAIERERDLHCQLQATRRLASPPMGAAVQCDHEAVVLAGVRLRARAADR